LMEDFGMDNDFWKECEFEDDIMLYNSDK
jgi:hypothetical protein